MNIIKKIWDFGEKHQFKIWWFTAIGFTLLAIGFFIKMDIHSYDELHILAKIGWVIFIIGMGVGLLHTIMYRTLSKYHKGKELIKKIKKND